MTVVCFGYEKQKIGHDLNGFGYLIPKEEGMATLGTLWDSSIFENRAPEGYVLLRSMLGGACFPSISSCRMKRLWPGRGVTCYHHGDQGTAGVRPHLPP